MVPLLSEIVFLFLVEWETFELKVHKNRLVLLPWEDRDPVLGTPGFTVEPGISVNDDPLKGASGS